MTPNLCAAANGAGPSRLQSTRLGARQERPAVPELALLGRFTRHVRIAPR